MKEFWHKIVPKNIVEYIIWVFVIYLTLMMSFPAFFMRTLGRPFFYLLQRMVPENAGLSGGPIAIAITFSLVVIVTLVGLLLTKIFSHRFSYSILFIFLIGILIVRVSWFVADFTSSYNYKKSRAIDDEIGSQLSLSIDKCNIRSEKHPIYNRQVYKLICSGSIENIELIKEPEDGRDNLLEVYYSNLRDDTPANWHLNMADEHAGKFELVYELARKQDIQPIYIHEFILNSGFNKYHNKRVNLELSKYVKEVN